MGSYLLVTATLLLAKPVFGWESDVHYGLTKWLAIQAGFSVQDAEIVAKGTWDMDHGINSAVHLVLHYACFGRDVQAAKNVRDSHFPSFADLPADVQVRAVQAGSQAASRRTRHEIQDAGSGDHAFDLEQFGTALHPLQDSWSHAGVPDPPFWFFCDSKLSWGHPVARGGYDSHDADLTYKWLDDTQQMAQATYEFMQAYLNKKGPPNPGKPWSVIEKDVKDFGALDTKSAKEGWFKGHGFTKTEFLDEITLKDGERPYAYAARLPEPSTKGLPDSLKARSQDVPPEVRTLFASLFEAWTTEKDFMRFQAKLQKLGVIQDGRETDRSGFERGKPDTLAAQLWTWRLRDHGLVNKLEHGKVGFDMLMSATMHPEALTEGQRVEQALLPLVKGAPPFLIVTLPTDIKESRSRDQNKEKPLYGALTRFKNAPHDLLMVIASENKGKLAIDGLYWTIDH